MREINFYNYTIFNNSHLHELFMIQNDCDKFRVYKDRVVNSYKSYLPGICIYN